MCMGMDCVGVIKECPYTKKGVKIIKAGRQELAEQVADDIENGGWRNTGRGSSLNGMSVAIHPGCPHKKKSGR